MQDNIIIKKNAFTMIELLVAIVIVGILLALLLPVIYHLKENAQRGVCINNMRQIGLAWHMYLDDHNGLFPDFKSQFSVAPYYIYGGGDTILYGGFPKENKVLNRYIDDIEVLRCPRDQGDFQGIDNDFEQMGTSYLFNAYTPGGSGGWKPTLNGISIEKVQNAIKTILLIEEPGYNFFGGEDVGIHWHDKKAPYAMTLFIDSHVKYILITNNDEGDEWKFLP
jgi:prepilin-type N-terminal cleavage/methylation domain-containing protein